MALDTVIPRILLSVIKSTLISYLANEIPFLFGSIIQKSGEI
jgi:hypothetical protein